MDDLAGGQFLDGLDPLVETSFGGCLQFIDADDAGDRLALEVEDAAIHRHVVPRQAHHHVVSGRRGLRGTRRSGVVRVPILPAGPKPAAVTNSAPAPRGAVNEKRPSSSVSAQTFGGALSFGRHWSRCTLAPATGLPAG